MENSQLYINTSNRASAANGEAAKKDRKVVLVGTGFVGMSMAYTFLSTGGVDELVLIDVNEEKAIGEAMDLQHGLPYARNHMNIKAGGYEECADAEIVVITAGAAQKPGETRLDMTATNARIMKNVCEKIMKSGFDGILIVASNPVDLMAYVAIDDLYRLLQDRNERRPEGSYTTYLFEKGLEKILKKCGEEATEVVVAAMKGSREETVYELADLCYHALVLMVQCGVTLDEVRGELASRHVVDHKVKQEALR